jgi:SpoIIAA-like
MKYLQIRPNREAGKCQPAGLVRPNTAGFGPTNGPTARSARDIRRRRVASRPPCPYGRQAICATASGRPLFRRRDPSCVRRLLAADDRRIATAVEAAIAEHDKIRLVYLIGHDFDDYEGGAVWEDLKLGVHHPASMERAAIVTDARWARPAVKLLGVLWPGQVRAFSLGELDAAKRWATESTSG